MGPQAIVIALVLAVAGGGYALNRGVYTGSEIVLDRGYYKKRCSYLLPSGTTTIDRGGWETTAQAGNEFCRLFHDAM